jgi:hypothetical protein
VTTSRFVWKESWPFVKVQYEAVDDQNALFT